MVLFIENPDVLREKGKHFTLKYKIPRNTTRIDVKTIQSNDVNQVGDSDENESHENNRDKCDYGICDKSDQNERDCHQIHQNNGEQPRSRFNLTCQLKDQVIVNHDYIQVEDGSYVATQSIEFNHHEQQQWLDQNNDQIRYIING